MSTKIYKLVLIRGYTEAYHQLSEEEKKRFLEQVRKVVREKAGAKMVTPYYDCRWSNDKYQTFFVLEYPDIESAIIDTTGVEELGMSRYSVSETIMGIERGKGPTS